MLIIIFYTILIKNATRNVYQMIHTDLYLINLFTLLKYLLIIIDLHFSSEVKSADENK